MAGNINPTVFFQELVWQILYDFDLEKGSESLLTRSPFLEMQALTDPDAPEANSAKLSKKVNFLKRQMNGQTKDRQFKVQFKEEIILRKDNLKNRQFR